MAMIELPKEFHPDFVSPGVKPTGPVEIDWANPLARGLYFAVFFEGSETYAVLGGAPTFNTGTPTIRGYEQSGTEKLAYDSTGFPTGTGTALFTYENDGSTPSNYAKLLVLTDSEFQIYRNNSSTSIGFNINSSLASFTGLPDIFSAGEERKIVAKWDENSNFRSIRVDDTEKSSSSSFSAGSVSDDIHLLNRSDGARNSNGKMRYCLIYDRVLSDAEHAALARDPYQILKPVIPMMGFWAAAAGGGTKTVTGSLSAILQKQGITRQATLNAILQKQGLTLDSSIDALLQKSVDITSQIDAILQKLGITSVSSIDALLQKSVTASASLDAILTAISSGTETASLDAILKKAGITGTASLDSILQKQGLNVSASLSALLQKAVSLSSVIDAILQKTVTTSASLDAILTQAGSGSVSANFDAILRKTLSVNLSIDALLQKQDITVYASIDALLQKNVSVSASLDAILYGTASIAASLDALLKRTGVSITANLDAILTASSSFITPKNLVYVMAEDRIVTVLAEDRIVKVI